MKQLLAEDQRRIERVIPHQVDELLREQGASLWLAGGYLRAIIAHEQPSDLDIFTTKDFLLDPILERFDVPRLSSDNAITVLTRPAIQFITGFRFETPESTLAWFDFTVTQAAFWFDGTKYRTLISEQFYPDLASKRLRYTDQGEVGGSLLRLRKYLSRGYSVSGLSLAKIVARLAFGDTEHRAEEERRILRALIEVDPQLAFLEEDVQP